MDGTTLRELAIKVSQYFLDFLESDFKRQQAPRRRIVVQTDAGFRAGMRIGAYPKLQQALCKALEAPATVIPFRPKAFTRPMSPTLRAIIREQIAALADDALEAVRAEVLGKARSTRGVAVAQPEQWVEDIQLVLAEALATQVVRPLLALLDGPLSEQAYSVVDSIYSTEADLVERLAFELGEILPEILSRYLVNGDNAELAAAAEELVSAPRMRELLTEYFETFASSDAFLELRDLEAYAATAERMQLYLYVGALKYGPSTYPLFYIPIEITRVADGSGLDLRLVNHLYVHKRAIDYVLQELGQRQLREWMSPVRERIEYIDQEGSFLDAAEPVFRRIVSALDLGGEIELELRRPQHAQSSFVSVTNALHFAVFDKGDEALLNDYEEMIEQARKDEPGVVNLFEGIVRGVLMDNPSSIHTEVEQDWDDRSVVDRVVIDSPIPLNEEQVKILTALRNPKGRFIIVEGPPGTGKSHTITAIAADCALRKKSCLVLSDKPEALDVVHSKLSSAMDQVRHEEGFPNPILRLGQQQANFRKLTSNQTLTQVSAYAKATRAGRPKVEAELADAKAELQSRIRQVVDGVGATPIAEVAAGQAIEARLAALDPELAPWLQAVAVAETAEALEGLLSDPGLETYLARDLSRARAGQFARQVLVDAAAATFHEVQGQSADLSVFGSLSEEQLERLGTILFQVEQLKMPLLGLLLRGGQVQALERELFAELQPRRPVLLRKDRAVLDAILAAGHRMLKAADAVGLDAAALPDLYACASEPARPGHVAVALNDFLRAAQALAGPLPASLATPSENGQAARLWNEALAYVRWWRRMTASFESAPEIDYVTEKTRLERLNTTVLNAEADTRLVQFMTESRADARALATVVSKRQKFPEEKFGGVKEAFPVIVASIREFGEYMPLAPGLFDVMIIDEASQVSVAQAFPALLRARQVVVMGDSKQFSNTKSTNASIALNDKYRADLTTFFRKKVSDDADKLDRLSRFDVKCSILEFFQYCANYSVMLRKHFRSYQELISYSSKTFYSGQLQAIKIRSERLEEVIRFDHVTPAPGESTRTTNHAEARYILDQLLEFLEFENPATVGVITPFREQQALLTRLLFGHTRGAEFQDRLKLKVMTFDSCQGEERQVIFYSLVATHTDDALNYVFPVRLESAEESVEEKLKVQRLNVGFSRAQETIWFVLSKPVGDYGGAIGGALRHYQNLLEEPGRIFGETDPNSPMEAKVLDWITKTPFFQNHEDQIEIFPQFPIGDYLRQLDPTYVHPAYKVDFLLTYWGAEGVAYIVLEYDGFEHHFERGVEIHAGNHDRYLSEADVERQLTLESYGYRFLRVNRFNLGRDPVQTLSDRLAHLVEGLGEPPMAAAVDELQAQAAGLVSKDLRACSRCDEIKPMDEFWDAELATGYGRVCVECKNEPPPPRAPRPRNYAVRSGRPKPRRWRY
ncbi:MAG: hypothetical protein JNK30_12415 [Phenylobacterium sp.]|uniref:AAA domain-containing protein n=1 Tax=Phenylobacterium sp. TaxID=1871053 RepID=UPI001A5D266D|nr:AAA domain-containing protein [Phenylobacterium sp.]MBL8772178.1 hypothetical protein [Phenylobacterium sp.]